MGTELGAFSRRRLLGLAGGWGLGWLGLGHRGFGLPRLRGAAATGPIADAAAAASHSPIRSCIFLFYYGGPSHVDTFDPKTDAPREVRGEYATIPTPVPGTRVCEHLPLTARVMDRVALVRSMHHPMTNHNSAAAEMLTGRQPAGGDLELLADEAQAPPTLGSVVSYGLGARANVLPYVALPHTMFNVVQLPGQTAGFLGAAHERFQLQGDPDSSGFRVESLGTARDGSPASLRREALLRSLDRRPSLDDAAGWNDYRERALRVLSDSVLRGAFDLGRESERIRERYGRNILGQSLLLARRLVEGGVNFVSVFDGAVNGQDANWDSHQNLFPRHRDLLARSDRAYSALIEDLEARGLLESTLVVAVGEFGRTPKVNGSAGRDHWPGCYTAVLAGGGARGGALFGASDKNGAFPATDPVSPADLAATILWRFGIEPSSEVKDQLGRPYQLSDGKPIEALFS